MEETQRRALIDRIVQEVLYRADLEQPSNETVSGTVVLLTSHVPSKKNALELLHDRYGEDLRFINLGTVPVSMPGTVTDARQTAQDVVTETVAKAANVVLLAPRIGLLQKAADGDDEDFAAFLVTRGLLWGRNVDVVLDFQPPRFKRNTFFEKLVTSIQTLEEMGARLCCYQCAREATTGALALVTEQDVIDAHKNNKREISCAPGAIVTALARDKARDLGIRMN